MSLLLCVHSSGELCAEHRPSRSDRTYLRRK
jgi:hypothetical protein